MTPWTAAYQAPPSMGFSRQEYWSGVPLPSPRRGESDVKGRRGRLRRRGQRKEWGKEQAGKTREVWESEPVWWLQHSTTQGAELEISVLVRSPRPGFEENGLSPRGVGSPGVRLSGQVASIFF